MSTEKLWDVVSEKYGYDFKGYSQDYLNRRLTLFLSKFKLQSSQECLAYILEEDSRFFSFLSYILVSVTQFFRNPSFFLTFFKEVVPILNTYPYIKIWHAGCASGEEVYSMTMLLKELGLSKKVILYGTDINEKSLNTAREGIYRFDDLQKSLKDYREAGGKHPSPMEYFTHKYEFVRIKDELKENIIFSTHNLVTDGSFGEMHAVVCRNVFIYFQRELQNKILSLFNSSLVPQGFLCLGPNESIAYLEEKKRFETQCKNEKIFRKQQ